MNIHLGIAFALVVAGSALVASSLGDDGNRALTPPASPAPTITTSTGTITTGVPAPEAGTRFQGASFRPWISEAGPTDGLERPAVPETRG